MRTRSVIIISMAVLAMAAASVYWHFSFRKTVLADIDAYLDAAYAVERGFIENFPVYRDYATLEKESMLRKFLLPDHIRAAKMTGIEPVGSAEALRKLASRGILVAVPSERDDLHYFYNVRKEYRYLTPAAYRGLKEITERLQKNIRKRKDLPAVKIAVSSAIRPLDYQKSLMGRNPNATLVSSHSYGVSFDIFFDDYYVSLPVPNSRNGLSRLIMERLNRKFGFLLGDALRRQFRSLLMETLLELQDERRIYAILERRQRCYHVTVLR